MDHGGFFLPKFLKQIVDLVIAVVIESTLGGTVCSIMFLILDKKADKHHFYAKLKLFADIKSRKTIYRQIYLLYQHFPRTKICMFYKQQCWVRKKLSTLRTWWTLLAWTDLEVQTTGSLFNDGLPTPALMYLQVGRLMEWVDVKIR